MNLRTGIFTVAASVACLCAMQSESNAQILQRGGGSLAARAARAYVVRAIPGAGIARQQFGNQGFGNQAFGNQGFGNQFGIRNGLQGARLFRGF